MRFSRALRALARTMAAPPRARLRILEEVGADLEDLYATLRAAGLSDEGARREAERILLPDAAAAAALTRVHRPVWYRWRERLAATDSGDERLLLGVTAVPGLAAAAAVLVQPDVLPRAGPFVVLLLGLGAFGMLRAVVKAIRIWGEGQSAADRIRSGSGAFLETAGAAIVLAALGSLHQLATTASAIAAAPRRQTELVLEWLEETVLLCLLGIAITLACGLCWLMFVQWAAVVEQRETDLIGPGLHAWNGSACRIEPEGADHG